MLPPHNEFFRRMFPTLRFNIKGLDEKATYAIYLDLAPLDDHRYKYSSGRCVSPTLPPLTWTALSAWGG